MNMDLYWSALCPSRANFQQVDVDVLSCNSGNSPSPSSSCSCSCFLPLSSLTPRKVVFVYRLWIYMVLFVVTFAVSELLPSVETMTYHFHISLFFAIPVASQ